MTDGGAGRETGGIGRRAALRAGAAGLLLGLTGCAVATDPTAHDRTEHQPTEQPPVAEPANPTGEPSAGPPGPDAREPGPVSGGPGVELMHATSGRPELALTFHGAGDLGLARKVLETLAREGTAVTVLAVGTWLQSSPDAARMATDLGHELGNHTWSHQNISALSESAQRTEIERCRDRIAALTGGPGAFFRQSAARRATPELLRLAGAAGYPRVLSYDVDSLDYTDPAVETVRQRLAAAKAGSVVSMHLGHPVTLAALPGILGDLRRRRLRAVTATRLFAP
ncbi:MAG: polysaccharide deacetylase family protein [Actinomycetota bacterium]|nr:polysaccharide deacetylase family protein [Actinomycetota bacterium]